MSTYKFHKIKPNSLTLTETNFCYLLEIDNMPECQDLDGNHSDTPSKSPYKFSNPKITNIDIAIPLESKTKIKFVESESLMVCTID